MKHPFLSHGGSQAASHIPAIRPGIWLAGSAATVGALGSTSLLAETVQITQTGNFVDLGVNNLAKDLTGDGIEDLPGLSTFKISNTGAYNIGAFSSGTGFGSAYFVSTEYTSFFFAKVAGERANGDSPGSATNFVPVQFSDARINGGAETNGLLEIRAANHDFNDHSVTFVRLVFDDAGTAEPDDAEVGGTKPEWTERDEISDTVVTAILKQKIKRLRKKIRRARIAGQSFKLRNLKRKFRQAQRELRSL